MKISYVSPEETNITSVKKLSGIFNGLFGRFNGVQNQHVIVHFKHDLDSSASFCGFESELRKKLKEENVGRFNCHEILTNGEGNDGFLYFDSKDGNQLLRAIRPLIRKASFIKRPKAQVSKGRNGVENYDL